MIDVQEVHHYDAVTREVVSDTSWRWVCDCGKRGMTQRNRDEAWDYAAAHMETYHAEAWRETA